MEKFVQLFVVVIFAGAAFAIYLAITRQRQQKGAEVKDQAATRRMLEQQERVATQLDELLRQQREILQLLQARREQ